MRKALEEKSDGHICDWNCADFRRGDAVISRRFFLLGAPAIVAASSLMPISVWYDAADVDSAMAEFILKAQVPRPFGPQAFAHELHPVARGLISARRFEQDYSRPWNAIGARSWANVPTPREDGREVFEAFAGPEMLNGSRARMMAPQLAEINPALQYEAAEMRLRDCQTLITQLASRGIHA